MPAGSARGLGHPAGRHEPGAACWLAPTCPCAKVQTSRLLHTHPCSVETSTAAAQLTLHSARPRLASPPAPVSLEPSAGPVPCASCAAAAQVLHAEICALGFHVGMNQPGLVDGFRVHCTSAMSRSFAETMVRPAAVQASTALSALRGRPGAAGCLSVKQVASQNGRACACHPVVSGSGWADPVRHTRPWPRA